MAHVHLIKYDPVSPLKNGTSLMEGLGLVPDVSSAPRRKPGAEKVLNIP